MLCFSCQISFLSTVHCRLRRIDYYRDDEKAEFEQHQRDLSKKAAWSEGRWQAPTSASSVIAVKPAGQTVDTVLPSYSDLMDPEIKYFPETFFGGTDKFAVDGRSYFPETFFGGADAARAQSQKSTGSGHVTLQKATIPDSMSYYQAVKLGQGQIIPAAQPGSALNEKREVKTVPTVFKPIPTSNWKSLSQVTPLHPRDIDFAAPPSPVHSNSNSRKIVVRGHTRGDGGDSLGQFVRSNASLSRSAAPVMKVWPPDLDPRTEDNANVRFSAYEEPGYSFSKGRS